MDLIPIRLAAGAGPQSADLSPEMLADVLWAGALPTDRLEHIRARHGPTPGTVDVALFILPAGAGRTAGSSLESSADIALRLCRRVLDASPALAGWHLTLLGSAPTPHMTWEIS